MQKSLNQLMDANQSKINDIQELLEYSFKKPDLLLRALTHRSFVYEHPELPKEDNETLEFLGDAALDLAIGSILFKKYQKMNEGELTKLRSNLVQTSFLSNVAKNIKLGDYLLLGNGEERNGGRSKASILACAYEAVLGAIYIDGGFEQVQRLIKKHFSGHLDKAKNLELLTDPKSRLQELTQEFHNETPTYVLDKSEGPDHDKTFTISIHFRGSILSTASAKSKKNAEQKAAEVAIKKLTKEPLAK